MTDNDEKTAAFALTNLRDDMVKLVAYTIVSLKRDDEKIMEAGQASVIVTDNMTGDDFSSWILAKYLQQEVDPGNGRPKTTRGKSIDPEDLKYLRVYYVVSNRWPRQPMDFEEREVEWLGKIRDAMV